MKMEKILLTAEEAAEVLGVGKSTVYDLMRMAALALGADRSVRAGSRLPPATNSWPGFPTTARSHDQAGKR